MNLLKTTLFLGAILLMTSCGTSTANQPATAEGFAALESNLKDQFGAEAFYTDLAVIYDKTIGNSISVTVTEAPESLKMGQWTAVQGSWKQNSEVVLG